RRAGPRLGGPRLRRRRDRAHAPVAALARKLDRGWHLGSTAQHHRQARARPAGLARRQASGAQRAEGEWSRQDVQLVLTEAQELLAKTAADFAAENSPVARLRALRDANDPDGFSRSLWKQMAELGWVGIPFPESLGGAGMGLAELAVVLAELGRKLAPAPCPSS